MNHYKKSILLSVYFPGFFLLIGPKILSQARTNMVLDSLITEVQVEHQIPAIVVSAIGTDRCYFGIGGTTKLNGKREVKLSDKFHLGSNSKAITAFVAMKMSKENYLSFDTKFIDLFPELRSSIRNTFFEITLADLLSHKARVQPYTRGVEFQKVPVIHGNVSERRYAFAKFVLNEEEVESGTYSNAGYVIASLMLEKSAEQTFEKLVEKYLGELGLSSYFGFPNEEKDSQPWGHWRENGNLAPLGPNHPYRLADYMLAAGDVAMNIIDYSKFIQLNLRGLTGEDNILNCDDYTDLHFKLKRYSYGWGNSLREGIMESHHDGSAGTYYCHAILMPEKELAVVVMANSAEPNHVEAIYELREKIVSNIRNLEN